MLNGFHRKGHDGEKQEWGPENKTETLGHLATIGAMAMASGFPCSLQGIGNHFSLSGSRKGVLLYLSDDRNPVLMGN